MAAVRQSNIELLRIASMAAVIMVHLDGASVGLPTPGSLHDVTAADAWRIVVESITIVGVNCFTLISGYFGIRARISGFVKFTLMCMFYSVGLYVLSTFSARVEWNWGGFRESWMVYTHTDLWYVPAYMLLYLVSPMLNVATGMLPLRKFSLWLGVFVVANVWCGWLWNGQFNPTGYTFVQLIMMYLVGQWLQKVIPAIRDRFGDKKLKCYSLALYCFATLLTALIAVWMTPVKVYAYNSPWVLASSVAIFCYFATSQFQSATVNSLAQGAFAAYLIHKNPAVWGGLVRPTAVKIWQMDSLWVYTLFTVGFTAAIYIVSSIVDLFRRRLFRKLESLIDYKVKVEA
ncbi:MAG: acyltransferase [Firmicutes bacterium]|nr:acyltransferase [Bacillota bacterium]MCM1401253.1 acyltransferase [Bacteroides sp.]MCM1477198.1 acyltransferase [Bacteroides sp.]